MVIKKRCTECREIKPLDQFYRRSTSKDGRVSRCKLCKSASQAAHYANNPDHRSIYMKDPPETLVEREASYRVALREIMARRGRRARVVRGARL